MTRSPCYRESWIATCATGSSPPRVRSLIFNWELSMQRLVEQLPIIRDPSVRRLLKQMPVIKHLRRAARKTRKAYYRHFGQYRLRRMLATYPRKRIVIGAWGRFDRLDSHSERVSQSARSGGMGTLLSAQLGRGHVGRARLGAPYTRRSACRGKDVLQVSQSRRISPDRRTGWAAPGPGLRRSGQAGCGGPERPQGALHLQDLEGPVREVRLSGQAVRILRRGWGLPLRGLGRDGRDDQPSQAIRPAGRERGSWSVSIPEPWRTPSCTPPSSWTQ